MKTKNWCHPLSEGEKQRGGGSLRTTRKPTRRRRGREEERMRKAFGETHTHNTTQKYTTRTNQEFVSLSMKFQASRFSASGRKMPLEPRRSEACRSCQPMHVLSFGEGRKWFVFWVPNKRNPVRVCFPPASPGLGKKVLEYTGPFVGWSRRQNWPPRSLDPDSTHSGYCACFPVLLFFLRVPKRFECFF